MSDPVEQLALLLELGKRARQARNLAELGFVTVNESKQLIDYRQAVLCLGNKIHNVSGLAQAEKHAPYSHWLQKLLRKQAHPERTVILAAEHADWQQWLPAHAVLLPLNRPQGQPLGLLLLAREYEWSDAELALLDELAPLYGAALSVLCKPSLFGGKRRTAWRWGRNLTVLALLAYALAYPVPLSTLAPAEVVAKDPFLVRAPIEGVIDRFHVRPNQPVKAGDLLFEFDSTSLKSKREIARSTLNVASAEFRQAAQQAVTSDKGKLDMTLTRGKVSEHAAEMRYADDMLKRVRVTAPRDGVAIFADTSDWVGHVVRLGERVIEIADPEQVELLIRIPVADVITLESGAEVKLFLASSPHEPVLATLRYTAYRAEAMPDGTIAYRAKASFNNPSSLPRVGLTGTAKLYAEEVPLAYYLLRRPLAAARQWLGW